ncbi:MAG: Gfo/Idh/MocA family oxidoreductase [Phycisphaerae bacterium]|nr:Gfo/Idh/MocA family oxidoreductase [Phycisphaerae bacterium]HON92272.1 Gfo/Idh/MocA family oxidoreductase [Sedimentisphaerales bacterium]
MDTSSVSRRDFIKASAASAAALGMTSRMYAAGSDTIRVGLIGCGGQGTRDLVSCVRSSPGVQIVALGDLFEDRLQESVATLTKEVPDAMKVPADQRFVGFDAYKKVLATDVQVVLLVAPPHWRAQHFQAAVEAGKHVFMEKPGGVDPKGIRSVIQTAALAEQKKLSVVAGTQRRHSKKYQEIIRRIHDGQIGQIVAAQAYWNGGDMLGYWKWWDKGNLSDMEWQCRSWPWFVWTSGDHIVEQHVHNLDVINWALQGHPEQCMGMGGRAVRTLGNIYDHFAVEYEYPGGVRVASMCRQINGNTDRIAERVVGTKGVADVDRGVILGEKPFKYEGPDPDHYVQEMADLISSVREGKPINEGKNVAESTMNAIMGRMSAYTGRALKWDWAMNASKQDLTPPKYDWIDLPVDPVAIPGKTQLV